MSTRGTNRGRQSTRGTAPPRSYPVHPFPEIPPGVTIAPFASFKEHGIQPSLGPDGIECDVLGIPTVQLVFKHEGDVSKTNPDGADATFVRPGFKKEWWQDWEADEHLQMHGPYDHTLPPAVLLRLAAGHFQKYAIVVVLMPDFSLSGTNRYRRFPGDVFKQLWELTFKIYTGILGVTPVWHKASDPPNADSDDISDDDFETETEEDSSNSRPTKFLRPREPYDLYGFQPPTVENDAQIQALLAASRVKRDARVERFVSDPARGIQVYLSSYMSAQGLTLSDRNLTNAPHLLRFFVNFLLRNDVFPANLPVNDSLKRSLDIIERAGTELPLTSKIAKALPDAFSTACRECWGGVEEYTTGVDAFESALRADNVEVIDAEEAFGGDASSSGDADDGGWAPAAPAATNWQLVIPASATLLALLGPTTLPLTHAPDIVERSVRRIVSIRAPAPLPATHAVEQALRAQFCAVELAPWPDWDGEGSEYATPTILRGTDGGSTFKVQERNITLVVDPAAAEHLRVGMGLGGVWVGLQRGYGGVDVQGAEDESKRETETEKERDGEEQGLWYVDKIMWVLPRYWIADSKLV
ncbi:hypothetical protein DFH06DRAFT_1486060 [Mycena polygramma]|nr:hypothetical protein DFH06DRAFT_1486060 [Mycena polygramma]